jgi:hypothetical protein
MAEATAPNDSASPSLSDAHFKLLQEELDRRFGWVNRRLKEIEERLVVMTHRDQCNTLECHQLSFKLWTLESDLRFDNGPLSRRSAAS